MRSAVADAPGRARGAAWRTAGRVTGAILVGALIAAGAFFYRFNALGGSFGGFDNDHFVHLLRSDMLLHGEQPLRDFADAELRGAWPSLGYATTAWAQQIWGRTLLVEAYLTVGGMALATLIVFLEAFALSGRWLVSILAAFTIITTAPKLYNYEKVLVLAVGAVLVHLWVRRPTGIWLVAMALWTAVAALFRHDFGVYIAMASASAILALGPAPAGVRARRLLAYGAATIVLLIPSIVWVQVYQGLVPYVERSLATIQGESSRTALAWPVLDVTAGADIPNRIALTYYAMWAIPLAAALTLTLQGLGWMPAEPRSRAIGVALLVLASAAAAFFLRGNLNARFGDAVAAIALLAAWVTAAAPRWPSMRAGGVVGAALWFVPRALLVVIVASTFVTTEASLELDSGGFSDSWEKVDKRFRVVQEELRRLPPETWSGDPGAPSLVAARYLAQCTAPEDRILLTTYVPEVLVLGSRLFAGGQGTFGLNFYQLEEQQREAVARLRTQSVPVVLASWDDYAGEFLEDYRLVAEYVSARYRDAGAIVVDGQPRLRVLVEAARPVRRIDTATGLPCFR